MKKLLGLVILAALLLSQSGCDGKESGDVSREVKKGADGREMIGNMYTTGLPIAEEKETFTVLIQKPVFLDNFSNMPVFIELEEKTNIHIDWLEIPADGFNEKVNVMFASGSFPDMMLHTLNNEMIMNYSSVGDIVPLNDLIENYAPRWKEALTEFERAKKLITAPDGNIYSLPSIMGAEWEHGMRDAMYINRDWLDALGLEVPKDLNELYDVLLAFKNNDPNGNGQADEIPWSFVYNVTVGGYFDIMSSFGMVDSGNHLYVDNGKVKSNLFHQNYREAIKYMNKLYSAGLIDPEAFTQATTQYNAKVSANPALLGFFAAYSDGSSDGANYALVPPLKSTNGETPVMRTQLNDIATGKFTLFRNNTRPEMAMRWADELADRIYGVRCQYDPVQINEDGTYTRLPNISKETTGLTQAPSMMSPFILRSEDINRFTESPNAEREAIYEVYKPFTASKDMMFPTGIFYTEEQNTMVASYWTDINSYVKTQVAKWITEGGIDEDWDSFVKTLEGMKYNEMMQIHQDAYDSYDKD